MVQGVDYIGVCVVYFCHDGKGNFVMAKRNNRTRDDHDCWDIGGGAVEFGDNIEDRLRQEIKEEYCADVISHEFLGYRDVHRVHEGKPTHWVGLDFKVLVDPRQVKIGEPEKFDDIGWFTLDTLPSKYHSQFGKFLELHRSKL